MFTIIGPKILGNATDELFQGIMGKITGTSDGIDFGAVGSILLWLVGLYVVSALFSYLQGYIMTGVSMKVTYNLRNDIIRKINRMPLSYFDRTSHGEVLSRVTNDVDTLSLTLNQSITQIITSTATFIGILVMMFSISWQMTLVALCIVPVALIFIMVIVKHSQKYFKRQQEYLGHVNGHVEEMYGDLGDGLGELPHILDKGLDAAYREAAGGGQPTAQDAYGYIAQIGYEIHHGHH